MLIDIPPTAQVRRLRASVICCCSATRAIPQSQRSDGSKVNMSQLRHLTSALARNSCTSSLINRSLAACVCRRCVQCSAGRQRADRCESIEMPRRTTRLGRLLPLGLQPALVVEACKDGIESARLEPSDFAQVITVTPSSTVAFESLHNSYRL